MANKYSKSNQSVKAQEEKTMQDYKQRRNRLNKTARVLAIVLIVVMVVFTVVSAGIFLLD